MSISNLQGNDELFHKENVPIYLLPAHSITNFILHILKTWCIDILRFTNTVDLKQYYHLCWICISLNTSDISYILIDLLTVLISFPGIILQGNSGDFSLCIGYFSQICHTNPLSVICFTSLLKFALMKTVLWNVYNE